MRVAFDSCRSAVDNDDDDGNASTTIEGFIGGEKLMPMIVSSALLSITQLLYYISVTISNDHFTITRSSECRAKDFAIAQVYKTICNKSTTKTALVALSICTHFPDKIPPTRLVVRRLVTRRRRQPQLL